MACPLPKNEGQRIEALLTTSLLNALPDHHFDTITNLARDLFNTPCAYISIMDNDKNWIKFGYDLFGGNTDCNTPFCTRTIQNDTPLIIPDTWEDQRFKNISCVTAAPNIRFYAGVPLKNHSGHKTGTLCILDTLPRKNFSDQSRDSLKRLASLAEAMIHSCEEELITNDKNAAKSEFISHVSHEIRTPVNAVIGISHILKRKTNLDAHTASLVDTLNIAAESLLELINSVLDLSAIESRKFTLTHENFALDRLFEEIYSIISVRAKSKNIEFTMDYSPVKGDFYKGDKIRLKQVLINLLNNAVKFTDEGAVSLTVSRHQTGIKFEITDTGVGIAPENIGKIFQQFEKINPQNHREGSGLGLYIVSNLIEAMKGEISITSDEGVGTSIVVTIPDNDITDKAAQYPANDRQDKLGQRNIRPHILIAEDNAPSAFVIQHFLTEFGYTHDTAVNGREVLRKLKNGHYDLILMDVSMPIMDGAETTRIIRNNMKMPDMPIIGMSGHILERDRQECLKAGMNDYITKPINNDFLKERIEALLSKTETSRFIRS